MKKLRKALIPIILIIAICISSFSIMYFTSIKSLMPKHENVIVVQNLENSDVKEILLDDKDSKNIIKYLKTAEQIPANYMIDFSVPACMFDYELYLKIADKKYYISTDDCDTVECNKRYFYITPSAKVQINDIIYKAVHSEKEKA